jgi:ribulose bisphosphate carboxylase small subunit
MPMIIHDLKSNEDAKEAVALLKELLAGRPDHSMRLVSVGIASTQQARALEAIVQLTLQPPRK